MIGFTMNVRLVGITNIRILKIVYLAVSRTFPYHLNVFNDVPANYSSGNLVNITGSRSGQRTYTNTINYTNLANSISATYNTFGPNLSRNYVALYLSAIYNQANYIFLGSVVIRYSVTTQVISID